MNTGVQNTSKDLSREELLSRLKSITFAVFMTALTSEMCIELEIMTPDGTCYQWIGYEDWHVYTLHKGDPQRWIEILKKLETKTLEPIDLTDTNLGKLLNCLEINWTNSINLSSFLSSLLEISSKLHDTFYCYYDQEYLKFYSSSEELKIALQRAYTDVDIRWEEMDTEELYCWWERYIAEGDDLPTISFDNNEE